MALSNDALFVLLDAAQSPEQELDLVEATLRKAGHADVADALLKLQQGAPESATSRPVVKKLNK